MLPSLLTVPALTSCRPGADPPSTGAVMPCDAGERLPLGNLPVARRPPGWLQALRYNSLTDRRSSLQVPSTQHRQRVDRDELVATRREQRRQPAPRHLLRHFGDLADGQRHQHNQPFRMVVVRRGGARRRTGRTGRLGGAGAHGDGGDGWQAGRASAAGRPARPCRPRDTWQAACRCSAARPRRSRTTQRGFPATSHPATAAAEGPADDPPAGEPNPSPPHDRRAGRGVWISRILGDSRVSRDADS
jgi:hypothetical protein